MFMSTSPDRCSMSKCWLNCRIIHRCALDWSLNENWTLKWEVCHPTRLGMAVLRQLWLQECPSECIALQRDLDVSLLHLYYCLNSLNNQRVSAPTVRVSHKVQSPQLRISFKFDSLEWSSLVTCPSHTCATTTSFNQHHDVLHLSGCKKKSPHKHCMLITSVTVGDTSFVCIKKVIKHLIQLFSYNTEWQNIM